MLRQPSALILGLLVLLLAATAVYAGSLVKSYINGKPSGEDYIIRGEDGKYYYMESVSREVSLGTVRIKYRCWEVKKPFPSDPPADPPAGATVEYAIMQIDERSTTAKWYVWWYDFDPGACFPHPDGCTSENVVDFDWEDGEPEPEEEGEGDGD